MRGQTAAVRRQRAAMAQKDVFPRQQEWKVYASMAPAVQIRLVGPTAVCSDL